jgi:hypothetical protein
MTEHGIIGGERGISDTKAEEDIVRMTGGDNDQNGSGPIGGDEPEVKKKDGGGAVTSSIEVVESHGSSTGVATTAMTAGALRNSGDGHGGISALPSVEERQREERAVPPLPLATPASKKWYAYLTTKEFYIIVLLG